MPKSGPNWGAGLQTLGQHLLALEDQRRREELMRAQREQELADIAAQNSEWERRFGLQRQEALAAEQRNRDFEYPVVNDPASLGIDWNPIGDNGPNPLRLHRSTLGQLMVNRAKQEPEYPSVDTKYGPMPANLAWHYIPSDSRLGAGAGGGPSAAGRIPVPVLNPVTGETVVQMVSPETLDILTNYGYTKPPQTPAPAAQTPSQVGNRMQNLDRFIPITELNLLDVVEKTPLLYSAVDAAAMSNPGVSELQIATQQRDNMFAGLNKFDIPETGVNEASLLLDFIKSDIEKVKAGGRLSRGRSYTKDDLKKALSKASKQFGLGGKDGITLNEFMSALARDQRANQKAGGLPDEEAAAGLDF